MRLREVGIVFFTLVLMACGKKGDDISPVRKPIVEAVYAGGTIHPQGEYKAFANATGILRELYVREGDTVLADQLLFAIEAKDPAVREQNAREALNYAESNAAANSALLEELRANIENAAAKAANDSAVFTRTKGLFESSAATKAELDRTSWLYEQSRALLVASRNKYASTRTSLVNQLAAARRQMELAAVTRGNFTVRSLIGGRIFAVYKEPGEIVNSQQPVAVLGDAGRFVLRLVVDQTDITRIATGQEVLYTIDALPDSIFSARVTKIYPTLDMETQSYRVDAECVVTPLVPYLGTQVQANIVVRRKENALVIPRGYLQPDGTVLVKNGGDVQSVPVKTGVRNLEYVEITGGLAENAIVVSKR